MTRERIATTFGWAASVVFHVGMALYIGWATTMPDLGFELSLPDNVEFGLTDSVAAAAGGPSAETPRPGSNANGSGQSGADGGVGDAGSDAGRRHRDGGAGTADAGAGAGDDAEGRGVAFLPAGSQIALRLDLTRVRASPLADDVRGLLAVLPDWRALLEGSGVDPLEAFDRLLIASPNLQRSRLIAAGRVIGDQSVMREAATRMAGGAAVEWREQRGAPVTDWHSPDGTERVLALVGPRHFVLCPPPDLPRVLAVARARTRGAELPADALLSMQPGEGLSLEVEGARAFARGNPRNRSPLEMVPTSLRMSLSETEGHIAIRTLWSFEDAEHATAAAEYWDRMRGAYAANPIVAILGVAPILQRATIHTEQAAMHGDTELSFDEMRRVLTLVRGLFAERAAQQQQPPPPPQQSDPGIEGPIPDPHEDEVPRSPYDAP